MVSNPMSVPTFPPPLPPTTSTPEVPKPKKKLSALMWALICVGGFLFLLVPGAIVAGLLLPALSQAKAKAQAINCVNNLKQLGLACRIYAVDHDGKYPKSWTEVRAEVPNGSILICPSIHERVSDPTSFDQALTLSKYFYRGEGLSETNVQSVVTSCPHHGHTLYADGSVQQGRH